MADEKDVAEILDDIMPEEPATEEAQTGEQTEETPASTNEVVQEPETPKPEEKPKEQYVPLSRFNEVNQEMKELREQNIRMQTLIDERLRPPAPPPVDPEDELLDPAVRKIKQENQQLKQVLGGMADRQDLFEARQVIPNYDKVAQQVDSFRREILQRGQYVSRVDAYTYLQGRDVISKPPAAKPKAEIPAIQEVKPEPIPATKPAAANRVVKKPMTDEEFKAAYGHIKF